MREKYVKNFYFNNQYEMIRALIETLVIFKICELRSL
jgi:hypothetical protein